MIKLLLKFVILLNIIPFIILYESGWELTAYWVGWKFNIAILGIALLVIMTILIIFKNSIKLLKNDNGFQTIPPEVLEAHVDVMVGDFYKHAKELNEDEFKIWFYRQGTDQIPEEDGK